MIKVKLVFMCFKRPPFCIDIFNYQTAIKAINFIKNTYMKNYKLYKYAFTPIVSI